jgi:fructose-1,6-bisphosphatase II / sedoheptulose-1,7-bisphosphatase
MVSGDVIFCASGVTSGDLATGIKNFNDKFEVTSLVLHKSQKINKTITNTYKK